MSASIFVGLVLYLLNAASWVERTDRVIMSASRLQTHVMDAETGLRGFLTTREERFLMPFRLARERSPEELRILRDLVNDNPVQTERVEQIEANFAIWFTYADRALASSNKAGGRLASGDAVRIANEGKSIMDEFRRRFGDLLTSEEDLRVSRVRETDEFSRGLLFVVVMISLAVAAVIALWGRRQLLSLSESYEELIKKQRAQNDELLQEQWFQQGRNRLSQNLLGQTTLLGISERIVHQLSDFLGAEIAAFYVADRGGKGQYRRVTAYGMTEGEATSRPTFRSGEGLLGSAVREKKTRVLTDLPADYFRLQSGLGQTTPKAVLLFPVVWAGEVNCALELGFLREPPDRVVAFLEQKAVAIATAVQAVQYREQLEELLAEVQSQAEELQAQQEEMRVSNEELEAQTKLLREAQTRSEAQNAELEQTNTQLEEQAQMLEEQKNLLDRRNDELTKTRWEIEAKANELSKASHYKSEFLANMSHELRTPLNSSLILSQLLAENRGQNLTPQQVEYANQITKCGRDLLMLINDVLDISKVESGKMDIAAEEFSLENLLVTLKGLFEPQAKQKGLALVIQNRSEFDKIKSDRQRLEQILKNLVSNALKFTDHGEVRIQVQASKVRPDHLIISVHDTGIGIQEENLAVIFEAFRQADGTTSRKYGGTGLGLSISRELARLLGGEIRVESTPGEGSSFHLEIPREYHEAVVADSARGGHKPVRASSRDSDYVGASSHGPLESTTPVPVLSAGLTSPAQGSGDEDRPMQPKEANRQILVVEDDRTFAGVVQDLIRELGFKPIWAETAEEGLEMAFRERPFAVVLDMKLPDHSGLYVLDLLKNDRRTRHIPVHVISVDDFSSHALRMGAVGYFLKPVKREAIGNALLEMREKFLEGQQKVLVIEDDESQRLAIRGLIEGDQVQITTAATGAEGLALLREQNFDCVVLDLSLPDTSGLQLLEQMADESDKHFPPVIVYTGRDLSRDEEAQLQKYSRSIIVKGARSPERLLDEVTLFLHQVEAQLPPRQQKVLDELRSREKVLEGRHLLLVDDDMRNVFALTAALEQRGAVLSVARNGREAIDKLESCLAEGKPADLVLMDIMMPVMDGYEAMREIRKKSAFKKLPIIALTAKAMKDDRERCLQAGASDYLPKPVQVDKLLSLIRVWLNAQSGLRRW